MTVIMLMALIQLIACGVFGYGFVRKDYKLMLLAIFINSTIKLNVSVIGK